MPSPKKVVLAFALFIIILPLAANSQNIGGPADLIFFGGTILTIDSARPEVEALAIKNGKILALGTLAEVSPLKSEKTQAVDLKGRTLLPSFIEPHGHPFAAAVVQFYAVDIRPFSVKDFAQMNAAILAAVSRAKPEAWIFLNGLDPLLQSGVSEPTLAQLNQWAPNNPLVIVANSGHAAYGNSLALKAAGITADSKAPPGSSYSKGADGQLTGTVRELPAVNVLVQPILKGLTPETTLGVMRQYYAYLAGHGITTVSDMSFEADSLPIYQAMVKDPLPPLKVRLYEVARPDNQGSLPPKGGDDFVRQNGVKWWADGSPWQGSIAVKTPFETNEFTTKTLGLKPGTTGTLNYPNTAQLQPWVDAYYAKGYQIAIHAEGGVAIDQALDVMEAAMKKHPSSDSRPRIQHGPLISEAQLQRAKKLGIHVSFLMTHIYYWGDFLPKMVGQERADNWNPTGSAEKAGIAFSFHNDGPVTPADPLLDFQVAILRQTKGSGQVLGHGQRISIDTALRARTIHAARELFMEKEVGSLEVGKQADLVILDENPRTAKVDQIGKILVTSTYINGKQVYPQPASK